MLRRCIWLLVVMVMVKVMVKVKFSDVMDAGAACIVRCLVIIIYTGIWQPAVGWDPFLPIPSLLNSFPPLPGNLKSCR